MKEIPSLNKEFLKYLRKMSKLTGGLYDRLMVDKEVLALRTIAVCFRCQMVEKIPEREGDIKPYQILCF